MKTWTRKLEVATNVAVLLACCLFAVVVWRVGFHPPTTQSHSTPQQLVGTKVKLPNVDWNSGKSHVVLALSTGCHYCSESQPFYRQLTAKATADGVKVVAVLPQTADESKRYLDAGSIAVTQVVQQQLNDLKVSGTPTLMLVNSQGIVTKAWIGKLDTAAEQQVLSSI